MATSKVLISDHVHPDLISRLEQAKYHVDYLPDISYNQFLSIIRNYHGLVINSKIKMNASAIEKAECCQFIARLGSGLDIIDLPEAQHKGIHVFAAPEGNRNAVAEHAVGMLLSLLNNLGAAQASVRDFSWQREANRGIELEGKTIGIIGFGNTGRAFAEKWSGWNVQVLAYDKYKSNYAINLPYVEESTLEKVVAESDILSIHLQLTEETHYLVNEQFIKKMKNGAILINTSRGKIVNLNDLVKALVKGKISGCCLDVLENEKLKTLKFSEKRLYKALFSMENVVLTPHIAGWTHLSLKKIANVLADKILK